MPGLLPAHQANAFIVAELLGVVALLPPDEIAAELGISEDAVRWRTRPDNLSLKHWGADLVRMCRLQQRLGHGTGLVSAIAWAVLGDAQPAEAPAEVEVRGSVREAGALLQHAMDALGDGRIDRDEASVLLVDIERLTGRLVALTAALRQAQGTL